MKCSRSGSQLLCWGLTAALICAPAAADHVQTVPIHNNKEKWTLTDVVIIARKGKITKVTDNGKFSSPTDGSKPNSVSVKFDGAAMPHCENTSVIVETEDKDPKLKFLKFSWKWKDNDGKEHEEEEALSPKDDILSLAVSGGADGLIWGGVTIPANQWGYFYQFDRNPEFTFSPDRFVLKMPSAPNAWGVLANTWNVPLVQADFPLDIVSDGSVTYDLDSHMSPEDMTGLAGIAPSSWSYDGANMVASYSALFNLGDVSSILWFTHAAPPELGGHLGLEGQNAELYAGDTLLFTNGGVAPPEPNTLLLLAAGGVTLLGRRRWC